MLVTGRRLGQRPLFHHLSAAELIDFWADDHVGAREARPGTVPAVCPAVPPRVPPRLSPCVPPRRQATRQMARPGPTHPGFAVPAPCPVTCRLSGSPRLSRTCQRRGQPHDAVPGWAPARLGIGRFPEAGRNMILTTLTAHAAPLAAILIIAVLLIGAAVTVVLVSLASKEERVEAIHAVAEVLRALLPWPSHRRRGGGSQGPDRTAKHPR
jgi:hypothetical protein